MKKLFLIIGILLLSCLDVAFIRALIVQYRMLSEIFISCIAIVICTFFIRKMIRRLFNTSIFDTVEQSSSITPDFVSNHGMVCRPDNCETTDADISYLYETNYERAQNYHATSPNPKFHRSDWERAKLLEYYSMNAEYINKLECDIWLPGLYTFDSIDDAIEHVQHALISAQELKEYCSKTQIGRLYFEDEWLHAHNSENPDFSFIDKIKERYFDLTTNYEQRKHDFELHKKRQLFRKTSEQDIMCVIRNNPGLLQKDIYGFFDSDLKPTVKSTINHLVSSGKVHRIKKGNTFILSLE